MVLPVDKVSPGVPHVDPMAIEPVSMPEAAAPNVATEPAPMPEAVVPNVESFATAVGMLSVAESFSAAVAGVPPMAGSNIDGDVASDAANASNGSMPSVAEPCAGANKLPSENVAKDEC